MLSLALGLALVALMLADVFQSVLLPRPARRRYRPSASISVYSWRLWLAYAMRRDDNDQREELLGAWAPLAMTMFLAVWVGGLVLGWGLVFWGLGSEIHPVPDFGTALYFAGTSLLTIGFGDVVATHGVARAFAVCAGASGFATVAVVTTFLFSVFGAFQRREVFVVMLGQRAGAPPSGVKLLRMYARLHLTDELGDLFKVGQMWTAEIMESHLAYPVLPYFRSTHDYESWVAALGALLDAATLLISSVEGIHCGEAEFMHGLGRHLTHDFADYFHLEFDGEVGVERAEFDLACAELAELGLRVRNADAAWPLFVQLRRTYASQLNAMARYWRIPPAQWVGDRSAIRRMHGGAVTPEMFIEREREDSVTR